jgi:hypothetical protein
VRSGAWGRRFQRELVVFRVGFDLVCGLRRRQRSLFRAVKVEGSLCVFGELIFGVLRFFLGEVIQQGPALDFGI